MSAKPAKQLFGRHKKLLLAKVVIFGPQKCTFGAQIKILRPLLHFKHSSSMGLRTPLPILRKSLPLSTIFKMVTSGARSNCDYLAMLA